MTSSKDQKYDRQLRLWGDNGQEALEQATVCVIGANAVGCEILKNLILPGIGKFVIVDHLLVTQEDLGNNFFLEQSDLNENRGSVALPHLLELNEDVSGRSVDDSVENLLQHSPQFFHNFKVVVVAQILPTSTLHQLSTMLWAVDIPLVVCLSLGLWGVLHLGLREHCIIQSHPEYPKPDLRLDVPFPALQEFCDAQKLDLMDQKTHSHTPWLVVLMKFVEKFRQSHDGAFPTSSKDKQLIKSMIRAAMWKDEQGHRLTDEENFEEAIQAVNTALGRTQIPSSIKEILMDERIDSGLQSSNEKVRIFWLLVRALKQFVENDGCGQLPVSGTLPDMTSDSERYVALQRIYQQKAEADVRLIEGHLDAKLAVLPQKQRCVISTDMVKLFCKNAAHLQVIRTQPFHRVWSTELNSLVEGLAQSQCCVNNSLGACGVREDNVAPGEDDATGNNVGTPSVSEECWYVAFRAAAELYTTCHHWPGVASAEEDSAWMRQWCLDGRGGPSTATVIGASTASYSPTSNKLQGLWDCINEVCRCSAGGPLHPVAAFMGGVAAQEVIKVITQQYVPVERCMLYNAIQHSISPLTSL